MSAPMPNNHEKVLKDEDFIVSKTDTTGKITYCNEIFMNITGMDENQLLGHPHSVVRHPDMPKAIFKLLWEKIKNKKEIFIYIKNLSSDGGFYWVLANITPSYDSSGNIIGYYSVRRKPSQKALEIIKPIYKKMLQIETNSSIDASAEYLANILKDKGVSYDGFITNIQS